MSNHSKRERDEEREDAMTSALIGGVVSATTDSALLGTVTGGLIGGDILSSTVGSVVGDLLSGGGLFD